MNENLTRAQIKADAGDRAFRSLQQGFGIDLLVGIGVALAAWAATLSDTEVPASTSWVILAVTVGKSVVQAAAAWLMRLKVAPAGQEG